MLIFPHCLLHHSQAGAGALPGLVRPLKQVSVGVRVTSDMGQVISFGLPGEAEVVSVIILRYVG